jgi:hypothetical protein
MHRSQRERKDQDVSGRFEMMIGMTAWSSGI